MLKVISLSPEHLRDQLSGDVVSVDVISLASNTTVKNLNVIYSVHMTSMRQSILERDPSLLLY